MPTANTTNPAWLKIMLLGFLIGLSGHYSNAQNRLLGQYANTQSYLLTADYGRMINDLNTQRYFGALATHLNKPKPELLCHLSLKARLIAEFAGQYRFQVFMGAEMGGDTLYREIGLGQAIVPAFVSYELLIVNAAGQVLRKMEYRNQVARWGDMQLNTEYRDTLSFEGCSPSLSGIRLHYSQQEMASLQQRVNLINGYYAVNFSPMNQQLGSLPLTEVDSLEYCRQVITNCQQINQDINNQKYVQELRLTVHDPANFIGRYAEHKQLLKEQTARVDAALAGVRDLYYQKGLSFMDKDLNKADSYFRKAVGNTFNNHHQAYLQMARINLVKGYPDSAAEKLQLLYPRVASDTERLNCRRLGLDVVQKYLDAAKVSISAKKYRTALDQNSKARSLSNDLSLPDGLTACNQIQSLAWNGIYQTMLAEAEMAFAKNDFDAAEELAEDAARTQRNNPAEIAKDGKPEAMLLNVYKQRYRYYLEQGRSELKAQNYQAALNWFDNAKALEGKKVTPDPALPEQRQKAAKPLFVVAIDSIGGMVAGNLSQARHSFDRLQERLVWYNLDKDADLNARKDKLKAKIFTQECTNAEKEFNDNLGRARQIISEKRYMEADELLTKTVAAINAIPRCALKPDRAIREQNEIAAAAKFQRRLQQAGLWVAEGKYEAATIEYKENLQFFKENNVAAKGLIAAEYPEWVIENGNAAFCIYACNLLRLEGSHQTAWRLLDKAMNLGYRAKDTKTLQTLLGTAIANQRHNLYTSDNQTRISPRVDVLNYTNGNKKWKPFKAAFLKQAKTLGWR